MYLRGDEMRCDATRCTRMSSISGDALSDEYGVGTRQQSKLAGVGSALVARRYEVQAALRWRWFEAEAR